MLSAIIAARESERALVPTLSALVPAAVSGMLTDVIVADANSKDATREVADVAGCRLMSSDAPLHDRLKEAAKSARTTWLMFLRAGTVPEPAWVEQARHFMETARDTDAAVFRPQTGSGPSDIRGDLMAVLKAIAGFGPHPNQGLIITRAHYLGIGGHRAAADTEADLLRRVGRRRIVRLGASAAAPR